MLEFHQITKVFSGQLLKKPFVALNNVSFTIEAGSIIGFLGANGAGKTTSIKIIMDFIRPTSGEVKFGKELGGSKEEAFKKIGYLPERPYFYPHLTGEEFCLYLGQLSGLNRKTIKSEIQYWAPIFKIDFALNREIKTYSKGMLQRVGFLSTLIHRPQLIILDEPLSGLDPIGRKELKDVIKILGVEGHTVFFSSHIVSDVEEACDNVIFLKDGQLVFNGSVDKVIAENIRPESRLRYKNLQGNLISEMVSDGEKSKRIEAIMKQGCDLVSLEPEKPSLEQIFYNIQ